MKISKSIRFGWVKTFKSPRLFQICISYDNEGIFIFTIGFFWRSFQIAIFAFEGLTNTHHM